MTTRENREEREREKKRERERQWEKCERESGRNVRKEDRK